MKPAGFLFLVPAGLACLAGAAEPPAGLVSQAAKGHILEGLPAYHAKPPEAEAGTEVNADPPATDPTLLVLPKLVVKEKRLPTDAADHLMSPRAFNRKMTNLYLAEVDRLGPLNSLLNRFTIPLLSPSRAQRGKTIQLNREFDRLSSLMARTEAKELNDFYDQFAQTLGSGASARR